MIIIDVIAIIGRQNLLYITTVMNMNENEILFEMYYILMYIIQFWIKKIHLYVYTYTYYK